MKSSHRPREMLNTLVNKRSKEQTRTITLKRKTVVRAPARSRAISGENNLATEGSSSTRESFIFRPPMTRQRALSAKFKHFSEVKKRGERSIVVGKASSADSFDSPPPPLPPIPDRAQEAIVLYGHRWVQLGYLAMLALISDWVCFSVAATPDRWDAIFHRCFLVYECSVLFSRAADRWEVWVEERRRRRGCFNDVRMRFEERPRV